MEPIRGISLLFGAVAAALVTGLFIFVVAGDQTRRSARELVDAEDPFAAWSPAAGGPGQFQGADCTCAGPCDPQASTADGFHYCDIAPTEPCVGAHDQYFDQSSVAGGDFADCVDANGDANGNCRATCDYVNGR